MRPIAYPVEVFYWNLHDEQGNTRVEIRDVNKNTIFMISIKGHEYYEQKRLTDEIAPLVARLMNDDVIDKGIKEVEVRPLGPVKRGRGRPKKVLA